MSTDERDVQIERARALLELGRPEQAEEVIGLILAADPTDRDGLALLIERNTGEGREKYAEDAASQLVGAYPDDVYGLTMLAAAWHDQGRDEEAEPLLRRAIEVNPDEPASLLMLGQVLANNPERLDEALDLADRVVRTAPDMLAGYRARAQFLARQESWEEAEKAVLTALTIEPTDAELLLLLGLVRAMLGAYEQSNEDIATALGLDPRDSQLRIVFFVIEELGVPDPLFRLYLTLLGSLGADTADYRVVYGREVQALGEMMTAAADGGGDIEVEDLVSRANRALDASEQLSDPELVYPVAEALQDVIDGASEPLGDGHPLVVVTHRAWTMTNPTPRL